MAIKYLDAKRLKLVFIGGGKWVTKHEDLLNDIKFNDKWFGRKNRW